MRNQSKIVGESAMLLYVLTTALSTILIHIINQQIEPLLSAFYTFLFCMLVYNSLSWRMLNKIFYIKKLWFDIVVLNVTTAISWIFTFLSLKYITPELYLFVYLCAMTIGSSIYYKIQMIRMVMLLLGLVMLGLTYHSDHLFLGMVLSFLGGISGVIYSVYSKKMTMYFSTFEVLSLRFYLAIIITFFLIFYLGNLHLSNVDFYWKFVLLSLVSIILPLTLFQVGLKSLSVSRALSYLPLAPLFCYVIHFFSRHFSFNFLQLSTVIFISIIMFIKREE